MDKQKPKIGLALGSGGARGLAHIGVIKVLEKNNIPIDYIAGTSIGAIVGGMYALTKSSSEIEEIALGLGLKKIAGLIDPHFRQGLLKGNKIQEYLETYVGRATFKNTRIPFAAVATDYKTGAPVVLREGNLGQALRASMSVPLAFKPVVAKHTLLVDGGLSLPVPVTTVKAMGADIVIAVNLDADYKGAIKNLSYYDLATNSLGIMRHHLAKTNVALADIVIEPQVSATLWFDFSTAKKLILRGEQAARLALPRIMALLAAAETKPPQV